MTGKAKYTADYYTPGTLTAKLVTSGAAHALIRSIDTSRAEKVPGVKVILTGRNYPMLCGVLLEDRPPLAIDRVRYYGEPVAMVVALEEHQAALAAKLVRVEYERLPLVESPTAALEPTAPILHESLASYTPMVKDIYPEPGTNIASSYKIRKGDLAAGWAQSDVTVEESFTLPQSDHIAMETRCARAEFAADGSVTVVTSSQSPFTVRKLIGRYFHLEEGRVYVQVPLVGGGFGGKAPVQLEILACIASQAVGGRAVKLANTREEDIGTSPGRMGLEATIRLGAAKDGRIRAAEMRFLLDSGAYTGIAPNMAKAIAVDCSGPYNMENLSCDALCVYTNHTYATSLRGFSHECSAFCVERAMDELAKKCGIDPLHLRQINAIAPGHLSPTQVKISLSNTGNMAACIDRLKGLIRWQEGARVQTGEHTVRAKGIGCFWKTPNPPTDASAGVLLTFNSDGSLNINTGIVEMGSGSKTRLVQMLADRMKMDVDKIHVKMEVDTRVNPHNWKTVASISHYLTGRALMKAADDLTAQLKSMGSIALRCAPEDLEVENQRVYVRYAPEHFIGFQDIVFGLMYPDGNSVGEQIMGKGSFVMQHLTPLDPQTGKGKTGQAWTVARQAVEVEFDTEDYTYRILRAATVIDVGKVLNPDADRGIIRGGMAMGLGIASREEFNYDVNGRLLDVSLRNYKVLHIGEEPEYLVEFVETPQIDSPYGTRSFSEHGVIGMPAALANALSLAANTPLNRLPVTSETIWRSCGGDGTGGAL